MPRSSGRPKNRKPKHFRLMLGVDAVTTWPTRAKLDGGSERVPGIVVQRLSDARPVKVRQRAV